MASFSLKKGDSHPWLTAQVLDADGVAVDLTGASVQFRMRALTGTTLKVNAAAGVQNALQGEVIYYWNANDVDTPGLYVGEFEITFADTSKQTVPNNEHIIIEILDVLP